MASSPMTERSAARRAPCAWNIVTGEMRARRRRLASATCPHRTSTSLLSMPPSAASSGRYFGEVLEYPPGSTFASRRAVSEAGVHRPLMAGISGTKAEGANSVVVSGGYEDDEDAGDLIRYTGMGGNDPATKKQIADQTLDQPGNAGLVTSQLEGLPVRVTRGTNGDPMYSPSSGFRYDGLFRVADHWTKIGKGGFRIWQFLLERIEGDAGGYGEGAEPSGQRKPGRTTGVVTRVTRNTVVTEWVKRLYAHRCQFCGAQIEVVGGRYAEGAHIRALGSPHEGPDTPDNVLCLCPTCHVRFDNGGVYVTDELVIHDATAGEQLGVLQPHKKHSINVDHLRQHRGRWGY